MARKQSKKDFSPTVTFGLRSPGRLSPIAETLRSGSSKASTLINTFERSPAATEPEQSPPVQNYLGPPSSASQHEPLDFDPSAFARPSEQPVSLLPRDQRKDSPSEEGVEGILREATREIVAVQEAFEAQGVVGSLVF
nr:hypothetical protein B0A51_17436 [Rachicladosporium sp. CCFEE 5018]